MGHSSNNHLVVREGRTKCKRLAATGNVLFGTVSHLAFLKLFNSAVLFNVRFCQEAVGSCDLFQGG